MKIISTGIRHDFTTRRLSKVQRTDEGFLSGFGAVARVGIMSYRLPDGSVRKEYVPPETLFNVDSMKSLHMKPVTDSHPSERLLNKSNAKFKKVGFTGETVEKEDDFLVSSMVVTDGDAINHIDNGRSQLSPGYRAEVELKEGVWAGEKYDAIQVKRTYNHLALVDQARGGADLKLHLDSKDECYKTEDDVRIDGVEEAEEKQDDLLDQPLRNFLPTVHDGLNIDSIKDAIEKSIPKQPSKETRMKKVNIDGIEYDASPEVANRLAKVSEELTTTKTNLDTLTAERDTLKDKVEKLEAIDMDAKVSEAVKARLELERVATPHLDEESVKAIDSMKEDAIMRAVILKAFPKADEQLKDASEAYIKARFDSAVEVLAEKSGDKSNTDSAMADTRKKANGHNDEDDKNDALDQVKARARMEDRLSHPDKYNADGSLKS